MTDSGLQATALLTDLLTEKLLEIVLKYGNFREQKNPHPSLAWISSDYFESLLLPQ